LRRQLAGKAFRPCFRLHLCIAEVEPDWIRLGAIDDLDLTSICGDGICDDVCINS